MHLLISLLYAPVVVLLLNYFHIRIVSLGVMSLGLIWLLFLKQKTRKTMMLPLSYIVVAMGTFIVNDSLVLKVLPLIISSAFACFLITNYLEDNKMIFDFLHKICKQSFKEEEKTYIHQSTLFWILLAGINILFHVSILLIKNDYYWIMYSSFGWYFVFIFGGIVQFLHRQFIFLKRVSI